MKPDAVYTKLRAELQALMETQQQPERRRKLRAQLEKKFMAAWEFAPDRNRRADHLHDSIQQFRKKDGSSIAGFDHCHFYTGPNDERVIVTQPYGDHADELKRDLTLHKGISAEVIPATDWGFYYPGKAEMIVIKFPRTYGRALASFQKFVEREELAELLAKTSPIRSSGNPRKRRVAIA